MTVLPINTPPAYYVQFAVLHRFLFNSRMFFFLSHLDNLLPYLEVDVGVYFEPVRVPYTV